MPDQTKPNQTSQSGILHFVKHSVRAYQKKFQLSRSYGSWDTGSGKFKNWKMSNLGFFEKWPPEAPKKGKNQFWWVPWWFWTPMLHQKKFRPFSGPGVIKRVHAHWTAPNSLLFLNCSNSNIHAIICLDLMQLWLNDKLNCQDSQLMINMNSTKLWLEQELGVHCHNLTLIVISIMYEKPFVNSLIKWYVVLWQFYWVLILSQGSQQLHFIA